MQHDWATIASTLEANAASVGVTEMGRAEMTSAAGISSNLFGSLIKCVLFRYSCPPPRRTIGLHGKGVVDLYDVGSFVALLRSLATPYAQCKLVVDKLDYMEGRLSDIDFKSRPENVNSIGVRELFSGSLLMDMRYDVGFDR